MTRPAPERSAPSAASSAAPPKRAEPASTSTVPAAYLCVSAGRGGSSSA
ncbi:MAG: hypothetical protein IPH09_06620 [bacterium]|nr:hypothetical protein [bacterium]